MLPTPDAPPRSFWPNETEVAGVILCGGTGSRLFPLTLEHQKSMLPVLGKPVLQHVIEFWQPWVSRFIFVVKHQKEEVIAFVESLSLPAVWVEPPELTGIADGLYQTRDLVGDHFIAVLGDCVCRGELDLPEGLEQGVVVWPTGADEDIHRSYSVELEGQRVIRLVEKPRVLPNRLCGTGYYFLQRRVFDYIERQQPSALRGEKEITDVLQSMVAAGEALSAIRLRGGYVNVTFPEDLARAEKVLQGLQLP